MSSWTINQLHQSKFWIFLLVGSVNTLIGYLFFAVAYKFVGVNYNLALLVAYALGILVAYMNHRRVTFKSAAGHKQALLRFVLSYLLVYLMNAGLLIALSEWASIDPLYGQAISLIVVALMSFVIQRSWVFKV